VIIDPDLPGNLVSIPNSPDGRNLLSLMGWGVNQAINAPLMDPVEVVVRKTAQ
jgi:hypothetical protein